MNIRLTVDILLQLSEDLQQNIFAIYHFSQNQVRIDFVGCVEIKDIAVNYTKYNFDCNMTTVFFADRQAPDIREEQEQINKGGAPLR